ncbi:MAG: 3-hydroxybutyryl-CoA dehydrogenase [Candidatus Sericytochromatia bacterium]|nr:3-hydroxybutyryl-CoA dehydrogenase [Candidatus Tanganyikabacteria bacterium]
MEIKKVGVIGGGAMGAGIAHVAALAGLSVVIKEIDQGLADKGVKTARDAFDRRVAKGTMEAADAEAGKARLSGTADYASLSDVDLVIEAVIEKLDLKKTVFAELDRVTPPHAILASNTSALPITELGRATGRAALVGGLHFFNPAQTMKLVEVIRGADTSDATTRALLEFCKTISKRPVLINRDTAGFLVNRLLLRYFDEAAMALQENGAAAARTIDELMVAGGFPMGPFTLGDMVGNEVIKYVIDTLHAAFPDRFPVPTLLVRMAEEGRWGQKKGAGFYTYAEGSDPDWLDRTIEEIRKAEGLQPSKLSFERFIRAMIDEAERMIAEGLVAREDVDIAMQLGTGMKLGPLAIADSLAAGAGAGS